MSLEKVLGALGRIFVGAGILVFLFIGYQLWGTNIAEARSQDTLIADTQKLFGDDPAVTEAPKPTPAPKPGQTNPPTTAPPNTTPAPPPAPSGSAVAVIKIPKINLQKAVVEGTGVEDLKKGPGHYENTPLPGQPGNASLAGHRTTYGAPFGDLGELKIGDEIDVRTKQGTFVYKMTERKIVSPDDVSVLAPTKDNRITLTTCHPKFSAAQRMVIIGALIPGAQPAPAPVTTVKPTTTASTAALKPGQTAAPTTAARATTTTAVGNLSGADVSGTASPKGPAFLWAAITTFVGFVIWGISRLWRRWPAYILGAPVFLVVLYFFFENFALLLPANA